MHFRACWRIEVLHRAAYAEADDPDARCDHILFMEGLTGGWAGR